MSKTKTFTAPEKGMTYQERRHVREVLMLKTAGYVTEGTNGSLRIKDERVLGSGFKTVSSYEEIVALYPHLAKELRYE